MRARWLIGLLAIAGCGGGSAKPEMLQDLVAVSGRVVFSGEPIPGAVVMFHPVEAGGEIRPPISSGTVKEDGTFTVESSLGKQVAQGIPAGEYRVTVSWLEPASTPTDPEGTKERLPAKYQNPRTSGLEISVEPGVRELEEIQLMP